MGRLLHRLVEVITGRDPGVRRCERCKQRLPHGSPPGLCDGCKRVAWELRRQPPSHGRLVGFCNFAKPT